MNKKTKIIVSIVGITIVLLALLGITYAYYLTRIQGNTNSNSISITTADLKLLYDDGTTEILMKENILPDNEHAVGTKDFSVTNAGNTPVEGYAIVLEYVYELKDGKVVAPDVFERPQDFRFTLTCKDQDNEDCNGSVSYFNNESVTILTTNINPEEVHNYSLKVHYLDPDLDQSNDMGKKLNLKVQIYGVGETADIEGKITGVTEENTIRLESDPKVSPILKEVDSEGNTIYKYKFSGVEVGTHKLTILDKDGNEIKDGSNNTIIKYLSVKTGEVANIGTTTVKVGGNNVSATEIAIKGNDRVASLNTEITSTKIDIKETSKVEVFNPYEGNKEGLAYNIIKNSKENKNGTTFVNTPLTKIAEEISSSNLEKGNEQNISINMDNIGAYASTAYDAYNCYDMGECNNGAVSSAPSSCSDIINKYVFDSYMYESYYVDGCDGETPYYTISAETTISTTLDDYGTSYYFRGNVEDNYVNFAGMCWRIVRIAGDGTTKLILEDQYTTCDDTETETTTAVYTGNWIIGNGNYGYERKNVDNDSEMEVIMNYLNPVANNTSSMVKAFYDFQITKLADYTGKLKSGDWCLGDKAYTISGSSGSYTYTLLEDTSSNYLSQTSFYYDAYTRLTSGNANGYQPTLKCNGTILNEFADVSGVSSKAPMYVSAITADEIVYAGGKYRATNGNYYLINNYQKSNYSDFWSLSPNYFYGNVDLAFHVVSNGHLDGNRVDGSNLTVAFRPSVSLASSAVITGGEGTLESPYIIG